MLKFPNEEPLLCRTMNEGYGFKHECLSSSFRIQPNGLIICNACATTYALPELQNINRQRRSDNE